MIDANEVLQAQLSGSLGLDRDAEITKGDPPEICLGTDQITNIYRQAYDCILM